MKINYYFILLFTFSISHLFGQDSLQWQLIAQVSLAKYEKVSINTKGQIYLTQENGGLIHLDKKGNTIATFSAERTGKITSLFTNNPLQLFLFYSEWQEFILLNRLLNPLKKGSFENLALNSNLDLGFVQLACPSMDNQIWLVDNSDFSLKKYNTLHHSLEVQTSLDLLLEGDFYSLLDLDIYQNKIYLHSQNGVLVFDTYGSYQKTIPIKNSNSLRFYAESLYYFDENTQKVVFYNLYTHQTTTIPLPPNLKKQLFEVIYFDNKLYLFFENEYQVFDFK